MDVDTTLPPSATVPLNALIPSILAAIRLAGVGVRRPDEAAASAAPSVTRTAVRGSVADLIGEGLLKPGAELYCSRSAATPFAGSDEPPHRQSTSVGGVRLAVTRTNRVTLLVRQGADTVPGNVPHRQYS